MARDARAERATLRRALVNEAVRGSASRRSCAKVRGVSESQASLGRAVVSIARTQRGRFAWAAWWSGAPTMAPFRKPDASGGGFASWHEARADAERVSGRSLADLDSGWADRKSTRLNSSHRLTSRMPSSA
jgi:hypothetical protein